jgi:L-serine dehydratase
MISVFDMFSIGIGPSSSHTVGPMRAASSFVSMLDETDILNQVTHIKTELYGSLGQTGKGHGTGKAIILGLHGDTPESIDVDQINSMLYRVEQEQQLSIMGKHIVKFARAGAINFHRRKTLPLHANGMTISAFQDQTKLCEQTYYSIGGGFVVTEQEFQSAKEDAVEHDSKPIPYVFSSGAELVALCKSNGISISSLMWRNESVHREKLVVQQDLVKIWRVMQRCIDRGIIAEGILPGGLRVLRRAPGLYRRLKNEKSNDPMQAMDWVNLFALAVNEENAAGGRVVTAPTNGAAGIIPAVLSYYDKFVQSIDDETATRFLLCAAAIGILYKKNASISGAEVGCQGEIGVACSMAAGALTEILGGDVDEVENAAEIGMEHNLGLTCDPVGGLVQVPCIERNAMGAIKAINASRLALRGSGQHKVSLDKVIKTMRETGNDMKTKYKETARGGLAVNIIEC